MGLDKQIATADANLTGPTRPEVRALGSEASGRVGRGLPVVGATVTGLLRPSRFMRHSFCMRRGLWTKRPRARVAAAVTACLVITAPTGGAVSGTPAHGPAMLSVTVSATACGPRWRPPPSGRSLITVHNVAQGTVYAVELVGANGSGIYGQVRGLAPGTEVTMEVALPPGGYFFECLNTSGNVLKSATEHVTGAPVAGAHPYVPVTASQLEQAVIAYKAKASLWLERLRTATVALVRAVKGRRLGRARALWLPAHLDYERLGAAYGAFGTINQEVNGLPQGLQGGVHSPFFSGFLRLEYGLWHGQELAELEPAALTLSAAVDKLVSVFPKMTIPPTDFVLSTEGILEGTMRYEMSGESDEGSHTNLATAWANVQGTQMALTALAPLLARDSPRAVAQWDHGLATLAAALKKYRRPGGAWEPVQELTTSQRERLDGKLGGLLEQLAVVPGLLQAPTPGRGGGR